MKSVSSPAGAVRGSGSKVNEDKLAAIQKTLSDWKISNRLGKSYLDKVVDSVKSKLTVEETPRNEAFDADLDQTIESLIGCAKESLEHAQSLAEKADKLAAWHQLGKIDERFVQAALALSSSCVQTSQLQLKIASQIAHSKNEEVLSYQHMLWMYQPHLMNEFYVAEKIIET